MQPLVGHPPYKRTAIKERSKAVILAIILNVRNTSKQPCRTHPNRNTSYTRKTIQGASKLRYKAQLNYDEGHGIKTLYELSKNCCIPHLVQAQEEAAFLSTNPENRSLSKQHEFLFLFHTTLSPMTC